MAARAAAAKPLRPTPAIPASPPVWVFTTGGGATGGGISRVDEKDGRAVMGEEIVEDALEPDLARANGRLRTGDSPPDAYGSLEVERGAGGPSPVRESGLLRVG